MDVLSYPPQRFIICDKVGGCIASAPCDVNLFQQAFSGGGTCDTITGTLRIEDGDGTDITDLTPLRALRYVNDNLIVYDTDELKNLEGLEGIWRVGGIAR